MRGGGPQNGSGGPVRNGTTPRPLVNGDAHYDTVKVGGSPPYFINTTLVL